MEEDKVRKITFILPNLSAGGAERVVSILSTSLSKRHYQVSIVLLNDCKRAYKVHEKVVVNPLLDHPISSKIDRLIALFKLRSYICKNPDHIYIPFQGLCLKYLLTAKKGKKINIISCERNDPYNLYKDPKTVRKIIKMFEATDYSVFQTEDARQFYGDIVKRKSSVICNPINIPDESWNNKQSDNRIVTFCRLEKQKNLYMAIEAIRLVKEKYRQSVQFDIFGQGSLQNELDEYIHRNNLSSYIFLKGTTTNVYKEMNEASAFILSSDYEGISNSMLEALAFGIPTICTDCPIGGARMAIINGENGFLVPVNNAEALSEKISYILSNRSIAIQISKAARESSKRWSVDRITEEWIKVFKQL